MDAFGLFSGILGLFFMLFWFALAILWMLVPFAVFGIKGLLRDLINEQQRTNVLLTRVAPTSTAQEEAEADLPTLKDIMSEPGRP